MTKEPFYLPGGRQCAYPECPEVAETFCDVCDQQVCEEHITKFRGRWHGDTNQCESCLEQARKEYR